jgi:hypothetical protein
MHTYLSGLECRESSVFDCIKHLRYVTTHAHTYTYLNSLDCRESSVSDCVKHLSYIIHTDISIHTDTHTHTYITERP